MKILLADDERELANALSAIMKFNGYEVDCVYNGEDAFNKAYNDEYDALVFDVMMPKMSGVEAVAALRKKNVRTPIILLTAKSEFSDKISGLDAGADDYLTKPFNTGELLARLRALIRRSSDSKNEIITCGNVTVDKDNLEIKTDSASFRLSGKEFKIFDLLVARAGTSVPEKLLTERLSDEDGVQEGEVFLYISYLRTKLSAIGANLRIDGSDNGDYILITE